LLPRPAPALARRAKLALGVGVRRWLQPCSSEVRHAAARRRVNSSLHRQRNLRSRRPHPGSVGRCAIQQSQHCSWARSFSGILRLSGLSADIRSCCRPAPGKRLSSCMGKRGRRASESHASAFHRALASRTAAVEPARRNDREAWGQHPGSMRIRYKALRASATPQPTA
jgi:hypothetical protein